MMFPILISVSLAPGSYFFCALAVVTVAAATTNDTKANWLVRRSDMVSSRLFFASVASRAQAGKNGVIPRDETSCCGHPDVVNMPPYSRWGRLLGSTEATYRTALSTTGRCKLSLRALARAQNDG